jgi:hypothetical protein
MKVGGGLALFTFESSIVLSLIILDLDINTSFPQRNNNKKKIKGR